MKTTVPPKIANSSTSEIDDSLDPTVASDFSKIPTQPPRAMHRYTGWARLRSMRTAIWLLIAVAAASVVGSIVPQKNNSASRVSRFISDHPFWGTLFDRLMLFEVFTSWWFLALVATLLFVLFLCLVPRTRALIRFQKSLRLAPRQGPMPSPPFCDRIESSLDVESALATLRAVLKKKRWRVSPHNSRNQFVAEKGWWREAGSLAFHWALFLVFLAGAVSIATKFEGYVAVVEGRRWFEGGQVTFDDYSEGRLARLVNSHRNFYLTLEDFEVVYRQDSTPENFTSTVVLEDERSGTRRRDVIRVNKPLNYEGVKIYQASYGWAADVRVAEGDKVLYEGPVLFFAEDRTAGASPPRGVVGAIKLPSASGDQAGIELRLFPDFRLVPFRATNPDAPEASDPGALDIITVSDDPNRPLVLVTEYRGDLQLDRPQNVYRLDKRLLTEVNQGFATFPGHSNDKVGESVSLSGGLRIDLLDLKRYSVFQVRSDVWGSGIAAVAGAAVFISLFPALYSWRRRVWVEVSPGEMSVVEVRGTAFQRKELFESEFESIVESMKGALERAGRNESNP
jgi:cytochrome c biogenesis protein